MVSELEDTRSRRAELYDLTIRQKQKELAEWRDEIPLLSKEITARDRNIKRLQERLELIHGAKRELYTEHYGTDSKVLRTKWGGVSPFATIQ